MPTIQFKNGMKVKFDGNPTPQDVEEVWNKIKSQPQTQAITPRQSVTQQQENKPSMGENFQRGFNELISPTVGALKGVASTISGMSELGQRGLRAITPNFGNKEPEIAKIPDKLTTPTNTGEKIGFGMEQIAEFLIPGTTSSKIASATQKATTKLPSFLSKTLPMASKMATEAGLAASQTAMQKGQFDDSAKVNAIIAAAFPLVTKIGGKVLEGTGRKIQQSIIKPSISDIKDGFKVENIQKYNLGGSLNAMLTKTASKMNSLSNRLKNVLGASDEIVDLDDIYYQTMESLTSSKAKNFGNNEGINRVLGNLAKEIDSVAPNMKANLDIATNIKRGAGTKGAWVFGSADPDASAVEKVYNTFYNKLKTAIEQKGGDEIKAINKELSDLIPIQNALLRRVPIAERNNLLSLTDNIGMFAAVFDPRALALIGAKKLSMSGNFANMLLKASEINKKIPFLGKRFIKNDDEINTKTIKDILKKH
ncbi:MAG: hypothetical protein WC389_20950 [Lutibacter sp.]|jgi:hypothetical protein